MPNISGLKERVPTTRHIERIATRGKNFTPLPDSLREPMFNTSEKAEQVWGMYNEYITIARNTKPGSEIPEEITATMNRLETEIARLWKDPSVKKILERKIKESVQEREPHAFNLSHYRNLKIRLEALEKEYFDLLRNQFLMRRMTPTLRGIDMARVRTEKNDVLAAIKTLEVDGGQDPKLKQELGGLKKEHADLAALIAYERIRGYHHEFGKTGVVMTPSRKKLLEDVIEQTSSGTWMQLTGETGTGKTTFAKQASFILTDNPPQYASGEKWGDTAALIRSKALTPDGRAFYEFGPLTIAITGCTNSIEMEEVIRTAKERDGGLLMLDELNLFDQDALKGSLKLTKTVRPDEIFNYKEMPGVKLRMAKKGFAIIATMNPATVRYQRKELTPELDRLFYDGKKKVDYLPMTDSDPELYEVFLAILMDDNGRIRIAEEELAPKYDEVKDEAKGLIYKKISQDPSRHGTLYRFALAAAEIHKSFDQKESVAKTPTDQGFLEKTVLDMEVLVNWMKGYSREIEGGLSLSSYLENKLREFYEAIDSVEDKAIFKRIFIHFGFEIEREITGNPTPKVDVKPVYGPLTPLEMGYLTPRTERPVTKIGEEVMPKTKIYITNEGEEIEYLPLAASLEAGQLAPGEAVLIEGKRHQYLGINPETKEEIFVITS